MITINNTEAIIHKAPPCLIKILLFFYKIPIIVKSVFVVKAYKVNDVVTANINKADIKTK